MNDKTIHNVLEDANTLVSGTAISKRMWSHHPAEFIVMPVVSAIINGKTVWYAYGELSDKPDAESPVASKGFRVIPMSDYSPNCFIREYANNLFEPELAKLPDIDLIHKSEVKLIGHTTMLYIYHIRLDDSDLSTLVTNVGSVWNDDSWITTNELLELSTDQHSVLRVCNFGLRELQIAIRETLT